MFGLTIEEFGSLDLTDAPNQLNGGAIDVLNVDFDQRGRIRSRDGSTLLGGLASSGALADFVQFMVPWPGQNQFLAQVASDIYAFTSAGSSPATRVGRTLTSAASIGTAAAGPYLYFGTGSTTQIERWSGTAFAVPAGMPNGFFLATSPTDNRLAAGYTSNAHRSRVEFSDPGAPETWGANNYVDLLPNDGEQLMGLVTWRAFMVALKKSKAFVFYGNSTDSAGNPIFNYRPIAVPTNNIGFSTCVSHYTGVYFAADDGIYRTSGGDAVKVSRVLDPLFQSGSIYFRNQAVVVAGLFSPGCYRDRVYFPCLLSDTFQGILVYDTRYDQWTFWIPVQGVNCVVGLDSFAIFSWSSTAHKIARFDPTVFADSGTAFTSRYRSGFMSFDWHGRTPRSGYAGVEKTVRETMLDGTGVVNYTLSPQWAFTPPTARQVSMGAIAGVPAQGRDRTAVRGRMFSYQLESTNPWNLQKIVMNLRGIRAPGVKVTP